MVQVKQISRDEHLHFIAQQRSVSFLQTPAWGELKVGWTAQSLGWFKDDSLIGAGLVLLRKVPRVNRYLAYLPEGPSLDWASTDDVTNGLVALRTYLSTLGVFQIKMGPQVWNRRWHAETLKESIANNSAKRISELAADDQNDVATELIRTMRALGWKQPVASDAAFGDYQPRFVFQINLEGKSEDDLFNNFNQLWRRNIRKADKEGVTVRVGNRDDLDLFYTCYVETAERDRFSPRPENYFTKMWDVLRSETPERMSVYIAEHPAHQGAIAATTMTRVGNHAWYSYGSSTTAARDLRPSNAIQWAMIKDALNSGCATYDMRGISETLDPDNHLFGLIQFKLGTGGFAQEYVGEWDLVIAPLWAKAFQLYMARR